MWVCRLFELQAVSLSGVVQTDAASISRAAVLFPTCPPHDAGAILRLARHRGSLATICLSQCFGGSDCIITGQAALKMPQEGGLDFSSKVRMF